MASRAQLRRYGNTINQAAEGVGAGALGGAKPEMTAVTNRLVGLIEVTVVGLVLRPG